MTRGISDILQFVEENDIKFIRLAFCDIFGEQKNIAILSSYLEHAFTSGVSFDASAISGFGNVTESDLFLWPDPDTLALFPWRPSQGCVARFYCSIRYPDGRPFEGDGRWLLARAEEEARQAGYSFQLGPECEFYLFATDEKGRPLREPFDGAGYLDILPMDQGENVRRTICLTLEEMGLRPERSHHEQGPGQNEIDFHCAPPLQAADNLETLRTAVKAVAAQSGLYATFLPKPLPDASGSGLHLNLSVYREGRNLFEGFRENPNPKAASLLAGILREMPEITAFANPLPSSYQRLGSCEAPALLGWSFQNRSQLVRVPAAWGDDSRIEVRSPDPSCNPYLVSALLLEAGLRGMEENLALPPSSDFDGTRQENSGRAPRLPASLGEALGVLKNGSFARAVLPEPLLEKYLAQKNREWEAYQAAEDPAAWESKRYFGRI